MGNVKGFDIENGVLKKYTGKGGHVAIPSGVTSIGERAFFYCSNLKSISIPSGVMNIGAYAFFKCSGLTSVSIPDGVTSIGDGAFEKCISLTNVDIPDSVTSMGDGVFLGCTELADENGFVIVCNVLYDYDGEDHRAVIPAGVVSISRDVFSKRSDLTSINIPASVTSVGDGAFRGCSSLTDINLPGSVTSIGEGAFEECISLTNVDIPDSVTSIGHRAFSGCTKLADENGFVIVCNVLYDYDGEDHRAVIPDGVTSIGRDAFSNCSGLTSINIPASVTSIGDGAFRGCSSLTDINLPSSVTSIGDSVFSRCSSLATASIPDGVTSIGVSAFHCCSSLTNINLPASVTSIGDDAFFDCSSLASISIPASVMSIGENVFFGCTKLADEKGFVVICDVLYFYCGENKNMVIPDGVTRISKSFSMPDSVTSTVIPDSVTTIGCHASDGMGKVISAPAKLLDDLLYTNVGIIARDGNTTKFYGYCRSSDKDIFSEFIHREEWEAYDFDLINNGPVFKYALPVRLFGMFGRLLDPVGLTEENRTELLNFLIKNAKKLLVYADELQCVEIVRQMFALGIVNDNNAKTIKKLLTASSNAEFASFVNMQTNVMKSNTVAKKNTSVIENAIMTALANQNMSLMDLEKKLKAYYALLPNDLPRLFDVNGVALSPFVFAYLLVLHEKLEEYGGWKQPDVVAAYEQPGLCAEAQNLLAMLDRERLKQALMTLADKCLGMAGRSKKMFIAYPFCRYADEAMMAELTKRAPKWRSSAWGNDAPPIATFRRANVYSNTRAAMLFADKCDDLDNYAFARGMTEDVFRDLYLSDVGLDNRGRKNYDLGNQIVVATLQSDLGFLIELPSGKTTKSIPKKGADTAKYDEANADFMEMKKAVKHIVKNRCTVLFADFLSGRARDADEWKTAYLGNPILRTVAKLLVWEQDNNTFTLGESGAISMDGQVYSFTKGAIKLAYPTEMKIQDVESWQKYFVTHSLKQPFEQIWEPVIDEDSIAADRYEGIVIDLFKFSGKDKHGIHSYGISPYSEDFGFTLDDCELEAEASTWRLDADVHGATYTLGKFTFEEYTRKTNHIVSYLDRITVADRIVKDDVSVERYLKQFTLAQIMEFIKIAQANNCINVTAILLKHKNTNYADADFMDEFSLDW